MPPVSIIYQKSVVCVIYSFHIFISVKLNLIPYEFKVILLPYVRENLLLGVETTNLEDTWVCLDKTYFAEIEN